MVERDTNVATMQEPMTGLERRNEIRRKAEESHSGAVISRDTLTKTAQVLYDAQQGIEVPIGELRTAETTYAMYNLLDPEQQEAIQEGSRVVLIDYVGNQLTREINANERNL